MIGDKLEQVERKAPTWEWSLVFSSNLEVSGTNRVFIQLMNEIIRFDFEVVQAVVRDKSYTSLVDQLHQTQGPPPSSSLLHLNTDALLFRSSILSYCTVHTVSKVG